MFHVLFAAALLMGASATEPTPALAPSAPERAIVAPVLAPVAKDDDPIICTYEQVLGTRFPKKICMHKSRREQATRESRDQLERMQRLGPSATSIK